MASHSTKYMLMLLLAFTPASLSLPQRQPSLSSPSLTERDRQFTEIIRLRDGSEMAVHTYVDDNCARLKGKKDNGDAWIQPIKYGINYSLKEQPHFNEAADGDGTFSSYRLTRTLETNEQIDFSMFSAPGQLPADPADPGCSVPITSAGGNTSLSQEAGKCYGDFVNPPACFRIWEYDGVDNGPN